MASIKTYAELIAYFETGDKPTQAQFEDLIYTMMDGLASKPKKYVANITQNGTNAPVATVLENTLGGTLVWSRTGVGDYLATLVGAFPTESKVDVYYSISRDDGDFDQSMMHYWNDADSIVFETGTISGAAKADSILSYNTTVHIIVYP